MIQNYERLEKFNSSPCYASVNWVVISWRIGDKPLPQPMLVYCQLDSWGQVSVKFQLESYHFHSRKCIWKCRPPQRRPFCPGGDELMWHNIQLGNTMTYTKISGNLEAVFSNCPRTWQASRQHCYRGSETSRDIVLKRLMGGNETGPTGLHVILTQWGRDKIAAISHTTFSYAFSLMQMYVFRIRFLWSLFLRVELTILQHWPNRGQAIIWTNAGVL